MDFNKIFEKFKSLPIADKITISVSLLGIICIFLPWYQDTDSYNFGNLFYGLTGPMYLAGIFVLAAFAANILLVVNRHTVNLFASKLPTFGSHLLVNAVILYNLALTYSVYFHNSFGVDIDLKQPREGLYGTLVCGLIMGYATILYRNYQLKQVEDFEYVQERANSVDLKGSAEVDHNPLPEQPILAENEIREPMLATEGQHDPETIKSDILSQIPNPPYQINEYRGHQDVNTPDDKKNQATTKDSPNDSFDIPIKSDLPRL